MSTQSPSLSDPINNSNLNNSSNDASVSLAPVTSNDSIVSNCTPRNVLFCCSSPICLNTSTIPKIVPVDYKQTMDETALLPSSIIDISEAYNDMNCNHQKGEDVPTEAQTIYPISVPNLNDIGMTSTNGIIINENLEAAKIQKHKTPPPDVKIGGVVLKRIGPPKTTVQIKKNEGPMLGVVLRKVEKKFVPQKSILDDDKPLYHISIVRSTDNNSKSSGSKQMGSSNTTKTVTKSFTATTASLAEQARKNKEKAENNALPLTNKQSSTANASSAANVNKQKAPHSHHHQPKSRAPITIQKIEGDKIIIIKKIPVPKNGKIPDHILKVFMLKFNIVRFLVFFIVFGNEKFFLRSLFKPIRRCYW